MSADVPAAPAGRRSASRAGPAAILAWYWSWTR